MQLEVRVFLGEKLLHVYAVPWAGEAEMGFADGLEKTLVAACRERSLPLPVWMQRNTREFAAYRQTVFFAEQYMERPHFDRFQIRLLQEAADV